MGGDGTLVTCCPLPHSLMALGDCSARTCGHLVATEWGPTRPLVTLVALGEPGLEGASRAQVPGSLLLGSRLAINLAAGGRACWEAS